MRIIVSIIFLVLLILSVAGVIGLALGAPWDVIWKSWCIILAAVYIAIPVTWVVVVIVEWANKE